MGEIKGPAAPGKDADGAGIDGATSSRSPGNSPFGIDDQDLDLEFAEALCSVTPAERAALIAAGIAAAVVDNLIGAANVELTDDGAEYTPCAAGVRCFILAVRSARSGSGIWGKPTPFSIAPEHTVRDGDAIDLVAFRPDYSARWALRYGDAHWLGAVEPRRWGGPPVSIWRSPFSWLRAGATGLVVLTRDKTDARELLHRFGWIDGEDATHVRELVRLRDLPPRGPAVTSLRPGARLRT